jgi:crotonobetainyl-CoA:carnitine CoA-transferase CaiB-like acyl-CoA transferase
MVLGDLGADVIKVERPILGDDLRHWGPPFMADGQSTYFIAMNRNKRSIAIDLKSATGLSLVEALVKTSDVLIENFMPGGMEALGLGPGRLEELNPRLVQCSITAYGSTGPLSARPGYDVILQAMSGLMSVTGEVTGPPVRVGTAVVDIAAGLAAANGVQAALIARSRTGKGSRVALTLLEVALSLLPNLTSGFLLAGEEPQRLGNAHPNASPYGLFITCDGHLILACGNDEQWRRLCRATGHEEFADHPDWSSNAIRIRRRAEVERAVNEWFSRWPTDELAARLDEFGVPNGPIYTVPQALSAPQVEALGLVREVPTPGLGTLRLVGSPVHVSGSPESIRPAPKLGEHCSEILTRDLGMGADHVADLAAAGAFGPA